MVSIAKARNILHKITFFAILSDIFMNQIRATYFLKILVLILVHVLVRVVYY